MPRFVADHVTQRDDSECQWRNCWSSVGCWLAKAASAGKQGGSPTWFRQRCGKAPKPGRECEPGGLADMIRGLMAMGLWNRAKYHVDMPIADVRKLLLRRNGAHVALETDFEVWEDEKSVCLAGYNDREDAYHSIGVVAGEGTGRHRGEVRVMQPLCREYKWVDVDEVLHAAARYNKEHAETRRTLDLIVVTPPMVK